MNSFEEIIRHAMFHEESEERFYRTLAEKASSDDLKQTLLHHAEQEQEHYRQLDKILGQHQLPGGGKRYANPDLHLAEYMVAPAAAEQLTYQDALLAAMQHELAAQRLYQDLAAKADDAGLREIFTFLAEQEGKHRGALEREYDDGILRKEG
ncbi:MAG: ferritin family protein [Magnetococcales bacterium]|nr:ferritin family protein [Magnetococcales bacterium]